jgi:DNA-binding response OmpR family regulator
MAMPYLRNGLDLLRQVRGFGMNVPVIMMCPMPSRAEMDAAQSAGAFAWLDKPFNISQLEHLVVLALGFSPLD